MLKDVMKHPDLPQILSTYVDASLLLKPRLSHFVGSDGNVFVEEDLCDMNETQAISEIKGWKVI